MSSYPDLHLYINGEWRKTANDLPVLNPATEEEIGRLPHADKSDLDDALAAAETGFRAWSKVAPVDRANVLLKAAAIMRERQEEIATAITAEHGKPMPQARLEVIRGCEFLEWDAGEATRTYGRVIPSAPGVKYIVHHQPIGIVAAFSPWNFPMATAVWKIAPALAFGNAVIWKPANIVPASAVALTRIIEKQDLPDGLFSLVMGSGRDVGQQLIESPMVNAISFTGSVPVGRGIAKSAIENFTRVQLEMGSKNALAIMDDADLDIAVACALNGAFGSTGQKCTASSRLVVHSKIHDVFVDRLVEAAQAMVVGHALEAGTQIGPVASEVQLKQNLENVALAQQEAGELRCGGERVERATEGYYMTPAVFSGTQNNWQVNREELFAPMACVIKVDSYEQALETVNDTRFGLTAGIITSNLARATHFRRNVRTGCVMVNLPTAGTDYHVPFGGRGESSYGPREQGQYAKEFYTHVKTSYISSGLPV